MQGGNVNLRPVFAQNSICAEVMRVYHFSQFFRLIHGCSIRKLLENVIINHLKLDEKLMLAAYFKARVSFFYLRAKVTSITYFS